MSSERNPKNTAQPSPVGARIFIPARVLRQAMAIVGLAGPADDKSLMRDLGLHARDVILAVIDGEHKSAPADFTGWGPLRFPPPPGRIERGEWTQTFQDYAQLVAEVNCLFPRTRAESGPARTMPPTACSPALHDVLSERARQVQAGYDAEHDDEHVNDEIAAMAACYMLPPAARAWPANETGYGNTFGKAIVPEGYLPCEHHDRRVELVRAVAMGLAEIERMDRATKAAAAVEAEA